MKFRLWWSSHLFIISSSSRSRSRPPKPITIIDTARTFTFFPANIKVQDIKMYGLKNTFVSSGSCGTFSSADPKTNFTVAVEGNIGSGKSTLLKHFDRSPLIEVIGEPLEKWTNVEGHNALGLLYEDPTRWSFSFNMYALLTRVQMHMRPHTQPVKMLERSLYSTNYCFVKNALLSRTINSYEHAVLDEWFQYLVAGKKADVDLIVYLRADPDICYERLRDRSRKEEVGVPMSLIESLHDLHDDWLLHKKIPLPAPVLVLDANSDLKTMAEMYDSRREEILCGVC